MNVIIFQGLNSAEPVLDFLLLLSVADSRVFMTVAIDLVIEGIQEPVRFIMEIRAKIFPANERFWYFTTRPHIEKFILKLKEVFIRL